MSVAVPPSHLLAYLDAHGVDYEIAAPGVPMPTVPAAAAAIGVATAQILKTLLFRDRAGDFVVAIACGVGRVDRERLAAVAGVDKLRVADAADVLRVTGYPAGGVAPLGLPDALPVIVDRAVVALPAAWGGAGREELLLRVSPLDVVRLNNATVAEIVNPA
ncbi:MAG: YbaK/EbsC family protein [Thermomicrobiales bacterium]|nr:YbaK/EbsC family protein [Thermomicrobiales bacterium]